MAEKWIQKAIAKPGALRKSLGVPADKNIPASKLVVKSTDTAKTAKRKNLAKTLRGFK